MADSYLDLDALEAEETDAPFTFKFDGVEYTMPHDIDVRAIAKLDAGLLNEALGILLGAEQWASLNRSPKVFGSKAFQKLLAGYFDHVGIDMGKSSGSTGSSSSTVGPSKRTSPGGTASGSRKSRPAR